ncbi:type 1 fimbrial protein [Providencia stuartii]|uniref:fimbrial protein n=1 Tax=Providencia TaxID=586 RepID=UPI0027FF99F1|nr:fimbrial protein [Providencia sp. 2023EL-00965]ELR5300416.1 type 1 fimbrial protein [Providencia stuartii]MDV5227794.1 fimbrial protein [Providencia rettgeri]MDW7589656.1 fimbrial protein [Providencia sp. 2023EL-00965]
MKTHHYIRGIAALLAGGLVVTSTTVMAESSTRINYSGTLIALPCTIVPGMENLYVDMGITATKSLYRFNRTAGKVIEFYLEDCDTSLGNAVTATFTGPMTSEGLLQFTPSSEAKGAGIGLEYLDGRPIPINDGNVYKVPIRDGDMTIRMKAYVQGEANALANKTLVPGEFNAVLTYTMSYE